MITNATLRRPSCSIVLNAIPGKHFYLPVIELDGNGNFHHSFWRAKNLPQSQIDFQKFRRHIKLNLSYAEGIEILPRGHFWNHRLRDNFGERSHPASPYFGALAPCLLGSCRA